MTDNIMHMHPPPKKDDSLMIKYGSGGNKARINPLQSANLTYESIPKEEVRIHL